MSFLVVPVSKSLSGDYPHEERRKSGAEMKQCETKQGQRNDTVGLRLSN